MENKRIDKLKEYLENDPDDSFTKFALALEYRKLNDLESARKLFEDIHTKDPDYIGLYYHLGDIYTELNDNKKAIATYREGIEKARNTNEQKTLSELQAALMSLELDEE